MRRFSLLDIGAMVLAKLLPTKQPNLRTMKDEDFISLLSWCEDWEPQKMFMKTAYTSNQTLSYIQTWDEWSDDMKPLPLIVRAELERAIKIHHEVGTMRALMTYAFFHSWGERLMKCTFWAFITVLFIYWFT